MTIDNLEINIKSSSQQASNGIDALASSLAKLKSITKGGAGLNTIANQLNKLNSALSNLPAGTANANIKILSIVNALNQLSGVGKSAGFTSTINSLKKLPEVMDGLEKVDMNKFATSIKRVADAMKPLADEMDKVSRGFSALPSKLQKIIQTNNSLTNVSSKTNKSFGLLGAGTKGLASKFSAIAIAGTIVGNSIGKAIRKSNEYVENINLFTVSLGEYADEALEYAEIVSEKLGIDPSDWIRAQGVFNLLATGFGIASDKAAIMSKNLTQLSYDLSSLANININEAMTAIQSAFAGELEPVRRRGFDLSQARLQEIAYAQGINMRVTEMNQAEKSMLRYYALMTQVTEVQGDMARTLNAPANQLRVFNAQLNQAQRAIGNIFIPALNAILPYLIALLKVIRAVAESIAQLFGFDYPEIDYSNVNNLGSGVSDNLDAATDSAKKLKNATMGFDELNILSQNDANGANAGAGGARFDLDIPEYDFLEGLTQSRADQIVEGIKNKLQPLLDSLGKFKDIKFDNLITSFENLAKAIEPLETLALDTLVWLIDNVLYPLSQFTIEDVLPRYIESLSTALGIFNVIAEGSTELFKDFYTNFLQPIAQFTANKFLKFWDNANKKLKEFQKILENSEVFEDLRTIFDALYKITKPLVEALISIKFAIMQFVFNEAYSKMLYIFREIEDVVGLLAALIKGDFSDAWEHLKGLMVENKFEFVKDKINNTKEALGGLKTEIATVASSWKTKIDEMVSSWKTKINDWWNDNVSPWFTKEKWDDLFFQLGKSLATAIVGVGGFIETWKTNISNWWTNEVSPWFTLKKWKELFTSIGSSIAYQFTGEDGFLQTWKRNISDWWTNDVSPWFSLEKWKEVGGNIKEGVVEGLKGAINTIIGIMNSAIDGFESLINGAIDSVNSFIDGYNSVADKVPGLASLDTFSHISLDGFKIDTFATGGFPENGFFYANSNELVGRFSNGKTAVANNEQITQGIAQAVYNAIVSANQQQGDNNFNLYIDGRQVNASVEKVKREKGASIMTGGLIYG